MVFALMPALLPSVGRKGRTRPSAPELRAGIPAESPFDGTPPGSGGPGRAAARRQVRRAGGTTALLLLAAAPLSSQQAQRLTVEDAIRMAQERNPGIQAMALRVEEQRARRSAMRASYFPQLSTRVNYVGTNVGELTIPAGSLGEWEALNGSFPAEDLAIPSPSQNLLFAMTTVAQPITHFFKIRQGVGAASADVEIAEAELLRVRSEVALGAIQLFGGLLIADRQRQAAEMKLAAAEEKVEVAQMTASSGNALEVAALQARVESLEARQKLIELDKQIEDLRYDLRDLLGLEPGTPLELVPPEPVQAEILPLEQYIEMAMRDNPEVMAAEATLRKAGYGVSAARAEYVPNIGLAVMHIYQSSIPFFRNSSWAAGLQLDWAIFDFGKRGAAIAERRSQLAQAQANLRRVQGKVRGDVEKAYRQVTQAEAMLQLAREAAELRQEAARLQGGQRQAGFVLAPDATASSADALQGVADLVAAELGYRLALIELYRAAGVRAQ